MRRCFKMVVSTRRQRQRIPFLPPEVWEMIIAHAGYKVFCSVRKVSRMHVDMSFVWPHPRTHEFTMQKTTAFRRRAVYCNLEWSRGFWVFQCLPVCELEQLPYRCILPPIFWDRRTTLSYELCRDISKPDKQPIMLIVHPSRHDKDIQVSLEFSRWSYNLGELNELFRHMAR